MVRSIWSCALAAAILTAVPARAETVDVQVTAVIAGRGRFVEPPEPLTFERVDVRNDRARYRGTYSVQVDEAVSRGAEDWMLTGALALPARVDHRLVRISQSEPATGTASVPAGPQNLAGGAVLLRVRGEDPGRVYTRTFTATGTIEFAGPDAGPSVRMPLQLTLVQ